MGDKIEERYKNKNELSNVIWMYQQDNDVYSAYLKNKFKVDSYIYAICAVVALLSGILWIGYNNAVKNDYIYVSGVRSLAIHLFCGIALFVSAVVSIRLVVKHSNPHNYIHGSDRDKLQDMMKCDYGFCNSHVRVYGNYIVSNRCDLNYERVVAFNDSTAINLNKSNNKTDYSNILSYVALGDYVYIPVVGSAYNVVFNAAHSTNVRFLVLDWRLLYDSKGETYTKEGIGELIEVRK